MCTSWVIGTVFVLISLLYVSGWQDLWILVYSIFFLYVSYSFERFSRIIFLESKRTKAMGAVRRNTLKQRNQIITFNTQQEHIAETHRLELAIMTIQAEEDKRIFDKEREAMTSLVGNVAHDLKTPLQSFRMDLELLKTQITKYAMIQNCEPTADVDDDHPLSTLLSLSAASDFMSMAINRAIDFAKATENIALVPSLETFSIACALAIPVAVIRDLKGAVNIIINPLPPNLCQNIISDKNWFSENVLCLLSNAVKYSDGGTVSLTIELLGAGVQENKQGTQGQAKDDYEPSYSSILVSIEDTGTGISKEIRDTLFQPFKQAQRVVGGSGLGLFSLSKRMEVILRLITQK